VAVGVRMMGRVVRMDSLRVWRELEVHDDWKFGMGGRSSMDVHDEGSADREDSEEESDRV
jgi:hypothetical protein